MNKALPAEMIFTLTFGQQETRHNNPSKEVALTDIQIGVQLTNLM
jgi:hypothetical protein